MASLNRVVLQRLAKERLDDARVLLNNQRFSAAFYIAGYAVECALKACIAVQTREHDFPDKNLANQSWTHKLEQLIGLTQIPSIKKGKKAIIVDCSTNPDLDSNWSLICNKWNEDSRYETHSESEAKAIIEAISNPKDGVLQWLQKYW